MMVQSYTLLKAFLFSFPFLPTVMHIILAIAKCISNVYLIIIGVCNTKTAPTQMQSPVHWLSFQAFCII